MEVFRKNEYSYTVWIGNVSYDLTGEWDAKAVAEFIKELTKEE